MKGLAPSGRGEGVRALGAKGDPYQRIAQKRWKGGGEGNFRADGKSARRRSRRKGVGRGTFRYVLSDFAALEEVGSEGNRET